MALRHRGKTSYSPKIVTDGLVLYLDADNPKSYSGGSTWIDIIGGNNGTLGNMNGSIISFNGSNTYCSFPNPLNVTQPYTVIVFAKPSTPLATATTGGGSRKTPFVGPGPSWNPGFWCGNNIIRPHCDTEYKTYYITWTDTSYRMIGQTFNGSNCSLIYNTESLSPFATVAYSPTNPTTLLIGAENTTGNSTNWNGDIPIVLLYNRELSTAEIRQNYNSLKSRFGL